MKFFNIILIIFLILVVGGTSFIFIKPKQNSLDSNFILNLPDFIYYYSENCPFCKELDNFLKENNVESKLNLVKKEISKSENLEELKKIVNICKLNLNEVGVPFVWFKGECLIGYDNISKYIKDYLDKINVGVNLNSDDKNNNKPGNFYVFEEVLKHNSLTSCWTVIENKIYDLTSWINNHPGGKDAIINLCGKNGSKDFFEKHQNQEKPLKTLEKFQIGFLKNE